jgi:serine/threonine-protein kinase haspin
LSTAIYILEISVCGRVARAFSGLETTVIDYTLSRADIVSRKAEAIAEQEDEDVEVAYLDLNKDPALFQGDASEEYQYNIYRYMRGAALFGGPLQSSRCLSAHQSC